MGYKHRREEAHPSTRPRQRMFVNEYSGYYPDSGSLETIKLDETTPDKFYKDFVRLRKPAIIQGVIPNLDIESLSPGNIVSRLHNDDQVLLVEKKDNGGFGSGTQRIKMSFEEFMQKLHEEGDEYYLTTQYAEDDPDEIRKLQQQQLHDDSEEDISDDGEDDEDDDEDDEEISSFAPQLPLNGDQFSDTDSIDFNDIHDDFDELSNASERQLGENEEVISTSLGGEPLTSSEAYRRVHEFVQKPLTNLVSTESLPLQPNILKKLVPQQINIWIGTSIPHEDSSFKLCETERDYGLGRRVFGGGNSSGLHHDHADNLYIPISGRKRFTIFAPSDADKMYTVGNINMVHSSGVIDYKNDSNAPGWRSLRGDGAIITEVARWRLDNDPNLSETEREELITLIDKEEETIQDFEKSVIDESGVKKDPPSFSRIPAAILHLDKVTDEKLRNKLDKLAHKLWPDFFKAKSMTASLSPGQMLFLPAGWFHEVTSFGSGGSTPGDRTHIALNYWYSPPNDADNVYTDDYWTDDFKRTAESCRHYDAI